MTNLKKVIHVAVGAFLVLFGLIGLILPILNGLIPLLLGLILLSFESPYIAYNLKKTASKTSLTNRWYEKLEKWMRKVFNA